MTQSYGNDQNLPEGVSSDDLVKARLAYPDASDWDLIKLIQMFNSLEKYEPDSDPNYTAYNKELFLGLLDGDLGRYAAYRDGERVTIQDTKEELLAFLRAGAGGGFITEITHIPEIFYLRVCQEPKDGRKRYSSNFDSIEDLLSARGKFVQRIDQESSRLAFGDLDYGQLRQECPLPVTPSGVLLDERGYFDLFRRISTIPHFIELAAKYSSADSEGYYCELQGFNLKKGKYYADTPRKILYYQGVKSRDLEAGPLPDFFGVKAITDGIGSFYIDQERLTRVLNNEKK